MAGKPAIITRVVDSMTDNLRPTRAEATDIANAVLDGTDGILLGAETLRGLYPIETIKTVGRICAEAERVYNQPLHYKKAVKHNIDPLSREEPVAASAVHAASKVKAAIIVVLTSSGRAARWLARYKPSVPVVAVVIQRPDRGFSGSAQARQCLALRGIYPVLATHNKATRVSDGVIQEADLAFALNHSKTVGLVKPNDRVVVFQKIGDSAVVKIIQVED
ncbi:pyruvate kinase [Ranunculus cassubicifolius]